MNRKHLQCPIPLYSLKNGEHKFHFQLSTSLFAENHYDDIHGAALTADVTFDKNSPIFMLIFAIAGTVNVTCDRCGDDFDMPVYLQRHLIVKTGAPVHQEEEDMVSITSGESDLDAAPYIYQYVALWLPMQRIHSESPDGKSRCNPVTIEKLNNIHRERSNDEQYIMGISKSFKS